MKKKSVIITCGDPAGCGPYICLEAIAHLYKRNINFILIADEYILSSIRKFKSIRKKISFIDAKTDNIRKLVKGEASKLSGLASLTYLKIACKLLKKGISKRLVTAPVSKEAIGLISPGFCGHTEFLAEFFKAESYAMMMFSKELKVVLLTRHVPLRDVPKMLDCQNINKTILLAKRFFDHNLNVKNPRIAVASFNPHAGKNTFLEKEEKIIVLALGKKNNNVFGPFAADTLFVKENIAKFDCIIALYHDQAMIPFKLLSLRHGVNITLGLPVIRTSPAHGVAYDLIAKGQKPFSSSMIQAVELSLKLHP
ncbi:MAG: 4-hydroxythreonine-4-phosphate dehydrogenase PdxA [Candidatus Omnitrophica bacterium]|nr:4-hydroxythreonine-4-phosphate dehydrogenase PdxA [Candidatus Omnitrophota bacterium]